MRNIIVLGFGLAACTSNPDSSGTPAPGPARLTGSPVPSECTYVQRIVGAVEDTGITLVGQPATICGQLIERAETDAYTINVDGDGADVIVTLTASEPTLAGTHIAAYDPIRDVVVASGVFVYDHGVFSTHLPGGSYELLVEANDANFTGRVPYALTIAADNPGTRCAPVAGRAADYTESYDGPNNRGNDVLLMDFATQMGAMTSGTAEPMAIALDPTMNRRISGVSANVPASGSYLDHDTFTITTDATTNQLAVRLEWTSNNTDLDYYIMPAGEAEPIASAATPVFGSSEFATFAVTPGTSYWLWVGATATSHVPAAYNVSLCAETF